MAEANKTANDCEDISGIPVFMLVLFLPCLNWFKSTSLHFLTSVPRSSIKRGPQRLGESMPEAPAYTSRVVSQTGFSRRCQFVTSVIRMPRSIGVVRDLSGVWSDCLVLNSTRTLCLLRVGSVSSD